MCCTRQGWTVGATVLGKLSVPGRPTILISVGQGPIALAVGAGGGGLDICTLIYAFSSPSPSLWETARYRLKYCLKGPLNPKQPTNQIQRDTGRGKPAAPLRQPFTSRRGMRLAYSFPGQARGKCTQTKTHLTDVILNDHASSMNLRYIDSEQLCFHVLKQNKSYCM